MDEKMTYFFEVYGTLPQAGPGDDVSTAQAYKMISGLPEKPAILDIGCGPGRQTLALARLSNGFKQCSDYVGYEFFVARRS